jgi:hypothetical protein
MNPCEHGASAGVREGGNASPHRGTDVAGGVLGVEDGMESWSDTGLIVSARERIEKGERFMTGSPRSPKCDIAAKTKRAVAGAHA